MKKRFIQSKLFSVIIFSIFLSSNAAMAQNIQIKGTLTDKNGETLIGATVRVKGTTEGTITSADGIYIINAAPTSTLQFSYIGYKTKEIEVDNRTNIDVALEYGATDLDEIIVTGYTSERKSDLIGAVSIIKTDEISSKPISSIDNMLKGQAAGVEVISSGAPGGASSLRIRGYSTIRNNDPLYIIDGVPTTSGINLINPNDIASLQILKDASSASIYGSRAANGVVIITTKKGTSQDTRVVFDAYMGIQNPTSLPTPLNAQGYADAFWTSYANDGITPDHSVYGKGTSPVIPAYLNTNKTIPAGDTKWVEEIFSPAVVQSYNFSLSKGGDNSHSLFSIGYFNQEGVVKHTGFDRLTARINSDYKFLNGKVTVGENITLAHTSTVETTANSVLGSPIYQASTIPSIAPVYDTKGEFTGYPPADIQNPLGRLHRNKDNVRKRARIFGNLFAQIDIVDGLNFKTNLGIDYSTYNYSRFNPTYKEPNNSRGTNELDVTNSLTYNWVWSNTLNYTKTFNDIHNVVVLLGTESIQTTYERTDAGRKNFPTDALNIRVLDGGELSTTTNSGILTEESLLSYFGKLSYTFDNKYLLSATVRRDGTSKLSKNRWGVFPAFSAGWRVSEETFFNKEGTFSNMKVRFGWGKTGNQNIPNYQMQSTYFSSHYYSNYAIDGSQNKTQRGYTLKRVANPDLKWETTTQLNYGLDLGILDNSINVTIDYFHKTTEDLLLNKTLPLGLYGLTRSTQWSNVGSMENKGFEFLANYVSRTEGDFNYKIGANLSILANKLVSLGEGVTYIETDPNTLHSTNFDQTSSRTEIEQPIASFYGHEVEGIFQTDAEATAYTAQPNAQAGDLKFKDVHRDGNIDAKDRTHIGSPHPDFTYGINFSGNYKAIDFTLLLQGSQGNEIYDLSRYYGDFFNLSNYNKNARILNAWTPTNTETDIPRISQNDLNDNIKPSSYYVRDGSYLRVKTLQIGYSLPDKITEKIKASKFRVYLEAHNLLTITGYEGLDPEIGLQNYSSDNRNLDIGVDRGIYPSSQTFTIGININF